MAVFLREDIDQAYGYHLAQITEAVGLSHPSDLGLPTGLRFCFLAFTNRCGSNYLADVLASSGKLNLAQEIYNCDMVIDVARRHGMRSFRQYFSSMAQSEAMNGRVLVKAAVDHLVLLKAAGILDEILPNSDFILMERADKLSQAISLSIANQTQQWASFMEKAATAEPHYNYEGLAAHIGSIVRQMRYFDEFFAFNGLNPICLNYEQFVEEPEANAAYISRRLKVDGFSVNFDRVKTERQAGSLNAEWRARFLAEAQSRSPENRVSA